VFARYRSWDNRCRYRQLVDSSLTKDTHELLASPEDETPISTGQGRFMGVGSLADRPGSGERPGDARKPEP